MKIAVTQSDMLPSSFHFLFFCMLSLLPLLILSVLQFHILNRLLHVRVT